MPGNLLSKNTCVDFNCTCVGQTYAIVWRRTLRQYFDFRLFVVIRSTGSEVYRDQICSGHQWDTSSVVHFSGTPDPTGYHEAWLIWSISCSALYGIEVPTHRNNMEMPT